MLVSFLNCNLKKMYILQKEQENNGDILAGDRVQLCHIAHKKVKGTRK